MCIKIINDFIFLARCCTPYNNERIIANLFCCKEHWGFGTFSKCRLGEDESDQIPLACYGNNYDLSFFATSTLVEPAKARKGCLDKIGFASNNGKKKKKIFIVDDVHKEGMDVMKHSSGVVTLGDLLNADEGLKALKDAEYDLTKNSCVNYAGAIWRSLRFD